MWIVHLYMDTHKTQLFKIFTFARLADIAYCLDKQLHEVSNFYHSIKREVAAYKKDGLVLAYIGAHDPEQLADDVRVPPEKATFGAPFVNQFRTKRQPGAAA